MPFGYMNEFIGKFANDIFFSLSVWATFVRTSSIPEMQRPVIQKCPVTVKDIPVVVKVN